MKTISEHPRRPGGAASIIAFVAFLLGAMPVAAQTSSEFQRCIGDNLTAAIRVQSCASVIESGQETGHRLAEAYVNRANGWFLQGENDKASADYEAAINLDPNYSRPYTGRGNVLHARGDNDGAIAAYDRAIRLDPQNERAYYNRGLTWVDKRELDRAIADFDKAINIDPGAGLAYLHRGGAFEVKGDLGRALVDYDNAIRLDPQNAQAYRTRGLLRLAKREYDQALSDLDAAVKIAPNYALAIMNRGNVWMARGDADRALVEFDLAIRTGALIPMLFKNRGQAYGTKGDNDAARADFDRAIELYPKFAEAYRLRGYIWIAKGDSERALADYDEAIRLGDAEAARNRGLFRMDQGNLDLALADFDLALKIDPRLSLAHMNRANVWDRKGDLDRAIAEHSVAISIGDRIPMTFINRGKTYQRKREYASALADYNEALKLFPESAEALNARGNLYRAMGDRTRAEADFNAVLAIPTVYSDSPRQQALAREILFAMKADGMIANAPATAERRIALVLANSAYQAVPRLANPARDARAIAATFRRVGFQTVTVQEDLTRAKLVDALAAFAREAEHADWAVIYFAGHGLEIGGVNYVLPVEARLESDRAVRLEGVPLDQVIDAVEGAQKLKLIFLDACRNNPFIGLMRRRVATRAVQQGLGEINPQNGTLVVYAAKHGQTALDGVSEANSPFAAALTKYLPMPGVEVDKLLRLIHDEVVHSTGGRQEPWVYGTRSSEDLYFTEQSN